MKKTVVPFRNGIMLSIAAGLVACDEEPADLCIAVHAGDHAIYPDCRSAFIATMRQAIVAGTGGLITLSAPFLNYTKADIVIRGRGVRAPMELSWSCYKGGEKHCGVCGTCVERKEAFAIADVVDPTVYEKET
jgi:7-cyano-7-deazaguanine synthase